MTLKAIVWALIISAIVGFHVHWYYERQGQKEAEYVRGVSTGLAMACDIVSGQYKDTEVIINNKPFEIVRTYYE